MKQFLDKDFLLNSETAKRLYHKHAEAMPIYDYHCHLSIKDIFEDRHFEDIVTLWLADQKAGDHYKWRALRQNGVAEKYITGDASNEEKFIKWAETVPYLIANPLYHWTHLELKNYFGINEPLNGENARKIYEKMNAFLKEHGVRDLIKMSNVKSICTTDDPIDDLKYHKALKEDMTFETKVYPSFRPDNILKINEPSFASYIDKLSKVTNCEISSLKDLEVAIESRIIFFASVGCRVSDHSLETVNYIKCDYSEANKVFVKSLKGKKSSTEEVAKYQYYLLVFLGKQYKEHNFVMQYHINAKRNNSTKLMNIIGKDAGGDSINDQPIIDSLSLVLDALDKDNSLPKTIVYSLNPKDTEALATLVFSFYEDGIPGKMQLGSAWWFLDQKDGIEKQLKALSNLGVLSRFVGMLTDSRSFLSFPRHEYFRRILCNYIGELIENGEYPNNLEFAGKIVEDICYNNAKRYFDGE